MTPEGWEPVLLGDIFREVVDTGHEEDLPVLSVTLDRGVVRRDSLDRKMGREVERRTYRRVQPGDIAYNTMRMWQGGSGLARETGYVSPAYIVVRGGDRDSPEFWAHAFKEPRLVEQFRLFSQGFAKDRHRLYFNLFGQIPALRPSLPEQRKIASILSSIDDTIERTETVIGAIEATARAVLTDLFTVGVEGRARRLVPLAEEWRLGRVVPRVDAMPECWRLVRLTEVARLESGHTPSRGRPDYWDGEIPWISLHDSKGLDVPEILNTSQTVSLLGIANSSARLLPRGTVVFSRTATVGKATIMGREMSTSQDFANYICGPEIHNRYLMQVFRFMQPEWRRLMAGSTHQTIYMPVFERLQVLLPPLSEQVRIADIAESLDRRIDAERAFIEELKTLKAGLVSRLMTGELRVPADEAVA